MKQKEYMAEDLRVIREMIQDGGWYTRLEACGETIERKRFYNLLKNARIAGFTVNREGNSRNGFKYQIKL